MKRQRTLCLLLLAVGMLMGGIGLLPALSLAATTVGTPVASPTRIFTGLATVLTVTSQITDDTTNPVIATGVNLLHLDAAGRAIAIVGTMRDDGANGDAVAGDKIFTLRLTRTESAPGELRLQVSAAFQRLLRRVLSSVTVVPIVANTPPVASAGEAIHAVTLVPLFLDGSASFDPDGDEITFHWTLAELPTGSTASIADASRPNPQFIPDLPGPYVFELVVNDGQQASPPARVTVSALTGNAPPNARAGRDQQAHVGTAVRLDGSDSHDANQTPLSFQWSLHTVPAGSTRTNADISSSTSPTPLFTPDVPGTYVLNLRVSNGILTDDATVQVVASQPNVAPNQCRAGCRGSGWTRGHSGWQ